METLENAGDVGGGTESSCVLQGDQNSSYIRLGMRAFFAILGLLLCLIETRADELPVIKDSGSKMATDQLIAILQGKIIGITGTIEIHQGKPEIKVMSPDQIKGLYPHLVQ